MSPADEEVAMPKTLTKPKKRSGKRRLSLQLPSTAVRAIELAAAELGQSPSDFAAATLLKSAHEVIEQARVTKLSLRDFERFTEILNDKDAKPNSALLKAAERYRKYVVEARK